MISYVLCDDSGDHDQKKYVLYLILGGLILFLMLAACLIEKMLSQSKREEKRNIEIEKMREKEKEKTQIESNFIVDNTNINNTRDKMLREPIMEDVSGEGEKG